MPRTGRNQNRGKLRDPVRCDETPHLQVHAGLRTGCTNHRHQHPVEDNLVNRSPPRCNARGKRGERDGHVGHDGTGGHRFHRDHRMRPHFVSLDGLHHLRTHDLRPKSGSRSVRIQPIRIALTIGVQPRNLLISLVAKRVKRAALPNDGYILGTIYMLTN